MISYDTTNNIQVKFHKWDREKVELRSEGGRIYADFFLY